MEILIAMILLLAAAGGASLWQASKRASAPAGLQVNPSAQASGTRSQSALTSQLPAEIGVAEASRRRVAGAFVLDVRQPEEWREVHIPGAKLIPLGELQTRVSEVPRDREILVVCRSGNRSRVGRDILRQAGYTSVTSMAGGVRDWASSGLPTTTGE